ncbi:hypothetical protein SRHO_G00310760 [Serrasalmus rhombeus]
MRPIFLREAVSANPLQQKSRAAPLTQGAAKLTQLIWREVSRKLPPELWALRKHLLRNGELYLRLRFCREEHRRDRTGAQAKNTGSNTGSLNPTLPGGQLNWTPP